MGKMTKDQNVKFNQVFEDVIRWGDDENCIGMFGKLVDDEYSDLHYLTTCVQEDGCLEILQFDGNGYYDLIGRIPLGTKIKTKAIVKNIIQCILDGGSFEDLYHIDGLL